MLTQANEPFFYHHAQDYPCWWAYRGGRLLNTFGELPEAAREPFAPSVLATIEGTTHKAKPKGGEVAAVSMELDRMRPQTVTPDGLARAISQGRAVLPSVHAGRRSPDTWEAQQLFFVDVDNERGRALPFIDAVGRASALNLPLLLSYESFSSTEERERYRLVFCFNEPVRDRGEAERIARGLRGTYPERDRSTTQLNRFFFGTDREVQLWRRPLWQPQEVE